MSEVANKRPFLKNNTEELYTVFNRNSYNYELLELLLQEITFRNPPALQSLQNLILQSLNANEEMTQINSSTENIENSYTPTATISPLKTDLLYAVDHHKVANDIPAKTNFLYAVDDQKVTENNPKEILSAWSVLELLSPQTFKDPEDLCNGDRKLLYSITHDSMPWEGAGEKARPNTNLYYHVPLGTINVSYVSKALLEAFGQGQPEITPPSGTAVIAFITLDSKGCLIKDNDAMLSSFAWAYPQVLEGNIRALDDWEKQEREIKDELLSRLSFFAEDGQPKPLTLPLIRNAFEYLINTLGISPEHAAQPKFILRKYQWRVLKDPPEPTLLNSFYLRDLVLAKNLVAKNEAGAALASYLGIKPPETQTDVLKDEAFLRNALAPENSPLGRWPAKEGHSLVLLQQAAVNIIKTDLKIEGLITVNGPPGTGKTTLLRDLVASNIVDRAKAMVTFTDPESAFSVKEKMRIGSFSINLSAISESLKGYEVLITSSNNKAVENISKELPSMKAIPSESYPLNYFRTISNANSDDGQDTWGLIAAVLGNSKNMSSFYKTFWSDEDTSIKSYLLAAAGKPITITEKDPLTGASIERPPHVVKGENAPVDKEDALKVWSTACIKFNEAVNNAEKKVEILENSLNALSKLAGLELHFHKISENLTTIQKEIEATKGEKDKRALEIEATEDTLEISAIDIELHHGYQPHFFSRFLKTQTWKTWQSKCHELKREKIVLSIKLKQLKKDYQESLQELQSLENKHSEIRTQLQKVTVELNQNKDVIEEGRLIAGDRLGDVNFWQQPRDQLQKSTVWLGEILQKDRDLVFSLAMDVHKAFIGAAAVPIRNNLTALMQVFIGKTLKDEHLSLLPDLWSTLFFVIPVLSTTFASIDKMIGKLPPKSLGWLFVDEAGQALPQSAVGALMRCKKAVIVGDPLQIEPVVSLPERITQLICREFGVDPEIWSAPQGSVQTCADAATKFGTEFHGSSGSRWVGLPLLVHRRCNDPMFKISNRIAYDNLMVYGASDRPSSIKNVLGCSNWFHITGSSQGNWSPEEGDFVIDMLQKIVAAKITDPDLYIIAPFRAVAQQMRERLAQEKELLAQITANSWQWINERVGTIHTFQGKEAEAVIMMLGAQSPQKIGARRWAGSRPNLINVAVTRAKSAFYVIGNKDLWAEHGSFQVLASEL